MLRCLPVVGTFPAVCDSRATLPFHWSAGWAALVLLLWEAAPHWALGGTPGLRKGGQPLPSVDPGLWRLLDDTVVYSLAINLETLSNDTCLIP